MKILVTGAAGFIGSKVSELLAKSGHRVTGLDNLNDYYDPRLKNHRLKKLSTLSRFHFKKMDIENAQAVRALFKAGRFDAVINLAARAGIPYSLKNPRIYVTTNMLGTLNLLEGCREFGVKKFVLASTSSLYSTDKRPFSESSAANTPLSPYAATKKGAEALGHSYSYLYGMDVTVLRYFTVYGPAGRPDMSPFRFIDWIERGLPLKLNGDGKQSRDFTYVDDIARGTISALKLKGFDVINLGGNKPHRLIDFVHIIEKSTGKKAKIQFLPPLKVDARHTWADISKARRRMSWAPKVSLEEGVCKTVAWYRENAGWLKNLR